MAARRIRNDPGQYDELAGEWWKPRGAFCALHWLAQARGAVLPDDGADKVLVDVGCGGGLLAPYAAAKGYRHIGVDIGERAVSIAANHGVSAVRGDARRLPIASNAADVVVAGEILEHVSDPEALIAESARVLRPGGLFVCDSLADTRLCKVLMVDIAERLPFVPTGIHDPDLFVDPARIVRACAREGIALQVRGLRPAALETIMWLARRRDSVTMHPFRFTGVVWQGFGRRTRDD